MDINAILDKVRNVCKHISDTDAGVWHTTEWNICSHIQSGLVQVFPGHNLDVELIKHDGRRPDIVIHRRGNNTDNLVVFQVKIRPSAKDLQDDMNKIDETFFAEPYNYRFGVLISIGKLPVKLPELDKDKVGILEVYGWVLDESSPEPVSL